jgi:hypothetical protein
MACRLSEAFRAAGIAPRLPTHPKAHFGILAHAFLRDAAWGVFGGLSEAEIRVEWHDAVEAYELNLKLEYSDSAVVPLIRTCEDFEVNAYRLIAAAFRLSPKVRRVLNRTSYRNRDLEVEGVSADGHIVGRLDRITWEDGALAVTDIKTGHVTDFEGRLRPELRIQLMLYSYLVHERFGRWPKTLRILPLRGDPVSVPFSPDEAQGLADKMKQILAATNQVIEKVRIGSIDESELASPAPDSCRNCRYRPTCEGYWIARNSQPQLSWPRDVSGSVSAIKSLGNRFYVVEIRTADAAMIVVRGIQESAILSIAIGMTVRICDLKAERAAKVYSWRPTSFIWSSGS